MVKSIISALDAESGASSHGDLGRRLPIRNQIVEVTLTLNGDLSKCLNADVGDATPLEGDEKLPNMTSLQLLKIQEPSHEQDVDVKVIIQHISESAKRNWKRRAVMNLRNKAKSSSKPTTPSHDNIPESSFSPVNSEHTASDPQAVHADLNWYTELDDTVWRIQIPS